MKNGHGRLGLPILVSQLWARLPQFCCFCHQKTDTQRDLCRYCQMQLPLISDITAADSAKNGSTLCLRCGLALVSSVEPQDCAQCAKYRTAISEIICPFRYGFPIDHLIGRLKYHQHMASGRLLGSLLAQKVANSVTVGQFPDFLLPVPLSVQRYRQRGFNHAAEIANACGKELNIPVLTQAVGRHFDTGSLAGLSRAERSMRIRGAFWASERLRSTRIAIVDDVLTTGATSGELATELWDSGIADIQLWVVARTPVTGKANGS